MKKILFLLTGLMIMASFTINEAKAADNAQNYKLIKTTFDYAPVRSGASRNAERFTHLREGISLYSNKETSDFYKVDLGLNESLWIEKIYAKEKGTVLNNKPSKVSKIKFYQDRKNYLVKIKTDTKTPYKIYQNDCSKNGSLKFQLYNINVDNRDLKVKFKDGGKFNYSVKTARDSSEILSVNFRNDKPIFGYDVENKKGLLNKGSLVLKIKKPLKIDNKAPLKNIKIALDAGHGGKECGAVSGGFYEKDINLQITNELNKTLKERGAKTILTRKKDVDTELYTRVDKARNKNADIFISIHQNSLPNPKNWAKKHGSGVYYYNENAKNLAYSVQKNLVKNTGFRDDGVFKASFAVVRSSDPVSILVECGYIIHPYERKKLTDAKFQKVVAKAIADGVEEYLLKTAL